MYVTAPFNPSYHPPANYQQNRNQRASHVWEKWNPGSFACQNVTATETRLPLLRLVLSVNQKHEARPAACAALSFSRGLPASIPRSTFCRDKRRRPGTIMLPSDGTGLVATVSKKSVTGEKLYQKPITILFYNTRTATGSSRHRTRSQQFAFPLRIDQFFLQQLHLHFQLSHNLLQHYLLLGKSQLLLLRSGQLRN